MENKGYELSKLPVYTDEPQDIRKLISRNVNFKGEFTRLAVDTINFLAYVDFKLDKGVRGNHYHKNKDEYLYLCKGAVKGYFKSLSEESTEIEEILIEEGTLIHILPNCAHAFETVKEGHAIEFSPTKFEDIIKDTISIELK